jgi:diguanylate cyclase (GGDEF)-like protein
LISIRKEMDESEQYAAGFAALLKVFLELATAVPKVALPANPELFAQCGQKLEQVTAQLKGRPPVKVIEAAGNVATGQIDRICASNQAALNDRDAAVKDVVAMVAKAVSAFKSDGERHKSTLSNLADGFEALSRVEDVNELRRRLRDDVNSLRESVESMRRDGEKSFSQFEADVAAFEQRLEVARKDSGVDRLTGLGSRRTAELHLQKVAAKARPISLLLFDIEGFRKINEQQGTQFGDKLLQALAHLLNTKFSDAGVLFRWAADEFLVIVEGVPGIATEQCRNVCISFASGKYIASNNGAKVSLRAEVAFGVHQYVRGESMGQAYRYAREALDLSRQGARA